MSALTLAYMDTLLGSYGDLLCQCTCLVAGTVWLIAAFNLRSARSHRVYPIVSLANRQRYYRAEGQHLQVTGDLRSYIRFKSGSESSITTAHPPASSRHSDKRQTADDTRQDPSRNRDMQLRSRSSRSSGYPRPPYTFRGPRPSLHGQRLSPRGRHTRAEQAYQIQTAFPQYIQDAWYHPGRPWGW